MLATIFSLLMQLVVLKLEESHKQYSVKIKVNFYHFKMHEIKVYLLITLWMHKLRVFCSSSENISVVF